MDAFRCDLNHGSSTYYLGGLDQVNLSLLGLHSLIYQNGENNVQIRSVLRSKRETEHQPFAFFDIFLRTLKQTLYSECCIYHQPSISLLHGENMGNVAEHGYESKSLTTNYYMNHDLVPSSLFCLSFSIKKGDVFP